MLKFICCVSIPTKQVSDDYPLKCFSTKKNTINVDNNAQKINKMKPNKRIVFFGLKEPNKKWFGSDPILAITVQKLILIGEIFNFSQRDR